MKTAKKATSAKAPVSHGVGRRKKSIARVWQKRGSGKLVINGKDHTQYFDTDVTRHFAYKPLTVVEASKNYDFHVNIKGGGKRGQATAVSLGIARALVKEDESCRAALRKHGLLTVDARVKERKKPGQPGARKKFQFTKR